MGAYARLGGFALQPLETGVAAWVHTVRSHKCVDIGVAVKVRRGGGGLSADERLAVASPRLRALGATFWVRHHGSGLDMCGCLGVRMLQIFIFGATAGNGRGRSGLGIHRGIAAWITAVLALQRLNPGAAVRARRGGSGHVADTHLLLEHWLRLLDMAPLRDHGASARVRLGACERLSVRVLPLLGLDATAGRGRSDSGSASALDASGRLGVRELRPLDLGVAARNRRGNSGSACELLSVRPLQRLDVGAMAWVCRGGSGLDTSWRLSVRALHQSCLGVQA